MRKSGVIASLGLFFFLIIPCSVPAHPHIFIESTLTVDFEDTVLSGIKVHWVFDEMFGASLMMDYDFDHNGIFDEKEIMILEVEAFANLENYAYFTHIHLDGKKIPLPPVTGFTAGYVKDTVYYSFFIPLNLSAVTREQALTVGCYDPDYYCYISNSRETPFKLDRADGVNCEWTLIKDQQSAYWGDTIIPEVFRVSFSKAND